MSAAEDVREVLRGAVDLYVHANPELMPRRLDDIALAAEMRDEGFRAGVNRVMFAASGERATLARAATGFDIRGAVPCNGTVGGLNPTVVEYSIRMGACYVSMPTLSGSAYQARISDYAREAATLAGLVEVTDEAGKVLPAVHDVLDVVEKHDVIFNLGYVTPPEYFAVLAAAREHGIEKISATNPVALIGLSDDDVAELLAAPQVYLEFASSSLRPPASGPALIAPRIAQAIKKHGADRCVLTSDTGAGNTETALELLTIGATSLMEHGVTLDELRVMVHDHPARLLGIEG